MAKWIDSQAGKLKVDDVGNIVDKHPYKYYSVANKIIKVALNPDGTEGDAEFFQPRTIVSYHPSTGEIMGVNTGFVEAVELEGVDVIKAKDKDGIEGVNIEITGNIPVDFSPETYKVKAGKLVKK